MALFTTWHCAFTEITTHQSAGHITSSQFLLVHSLLLSHQSMTAHTCTVCPFVCQWQFAACCYALLCVSDSLQPVVMSCCVSATVCSLLLCPVVSVTICSLLLCPVLSVTICSLFLCPVLPVTICSLLLCPVLSVTVCSLLLCPVLSVTVCRLLLYPLFTYSFSVFHSVVLLLSQLYSQFFTFSTSSCSCSHSTLNTIKQLWHCLNDCCCVMINVCWQSVCVCVNVYNCYCNSNLFHIQRSMIGKKSFGIGTCHNALYNILHNVSFTHLPYVHFIPWLAQNCRWHLLADMVVFIESDEVLTIVFYFFIPEVRICTSPVNQLPTVWQTSFTRTQISYTRNQLHSRTINLCSRWPHYQHTYLLDCQRQTLVFSMKISFVSFFFILGWMFACVMLLPFTVCYIMNTSSFPHTLQCQLNRIYIPLLAAHKISDSKISGAIPF